MRCLASAAHSILKDVTPPVRQLAAMLFGIWFRMVYHTEVNGMSLEAIAKSVTGSVFHTCSHDPKLVRCAHSTVYSTALTECTPLL